MAQGEGCEEHLTDAEVLCFVKAAAPRTVLCKLRVMLWIRTISRAPPVVARALALAVDAPRSWLKAVHDDLEWLAYNTKEFRSSRGTPLEVWAAHTHSQPGPLRKAVAKATLDHTLSHPDHWQGVGYPRRAREEERLCCEVCNGVFVGPQ